MFHQEVSLYLLCKPHSMVICYYYWFISLFKIRDGDHSYMRHLNE